MSVKNNNISAAIYVGAYSIQMLLARVYEGSRLETINEFTAFTRMSSNLAKVRLLSEEGIARSADILREMHEIARKEDVSEYRLAAASTLKCAANRSQLFLECQKEFGIYPQILGGLDESRLHFIGAVYDALENMPVIAAYIGYNAMHFTCGTSEQIDIVKKIDLGAAALNEEFKTNECSLSFFALRAVRNRIASELKDLEGEYRDWASRFKIEPQFMALGPLPTACASLISRQKIYDIKSLSGIPRKAAELAELAKTLPGMSVPDILKLPGMDPEMSESIIANTLILKQLLDMTGVRDFRISPYGLCAGMLKSPSSLIATITAR